MDSYKSTAQYKLKPEMYKINQNDVTLLFEQLKLKIKIKMLTSFSQIHHN